MIDPAQVAFILNRCISENVVLAQEIVHSFRYTKKKKGCIGLKIDFQKAYDKMEWEFLITTFKAFGFSLKFTKQIHQCLSTVNYTLLLNGSQEAKIISLRGLRQGAPLFLYLCIIGSEVLARLINREVSRGNNKGVKVANGAPPISKLFFADDAMFFCNAKMSEVRSLVTDETFKDL